jgi:hypothetical protein
MKPLINAAALAAIVAALSPSLSAQWPSYPTQGLPRTPGGQPDLAAPAPRTADGKPDLSGLWENRGGFRRDDRPPAAPPGVPPTAMFWNVGAGFKDGLPLQEWAADLRKQRMASDGRPAPGNDPQPWWYGYSRGRWDGDTLVVETTHFRDGGWLDVNGSPLTDAAKVIERFRRVNLGQLEVEITVDDPKAYTRPWTVKVSQRLMPDTQLIEFVCHENEKFTRRLVK